MPQARVAREQAQTTSDAGSRPSRSASYGIQPTRQPLLAVPRIAVAGYVSASCKSNISGEREDANDLFDGLDGDTRLSLNLDGGHGTDLQGAEDRGEVAGAQVTRAGKAHHS